MNSNIDAIIAQVLSQFKRYNTSDVIDENSMYRDVILAIRSFGNDITEVYEDVVEIRNGEGKLPDNFYRLKGAILCSPDTYYAQNIEYRRLIDLGYISNVTELSTRWNKCETDCCGDVTESVFTKELYFAENSRVKLNYKKIKYLKLSPTIDKKLCASDCSNFGYFEGDDEIMIVRDKLKANFNEGSIYIMFQGLPVDESGNVELPETPNGHLEKFIEGLLKVETAERLITNGDNVEGLMRLYPTWKQELPILRRKASNELKNKNFNLARVTKRIVMLNRADYKRYSFAR